MPSIAELISARARTQPGLPALLAPGRRPASYSDLSAQLLSGAETLRRVGLGDSARIAVSLPNGPEAAAATLSVVTCGACVPLNPAYRANEFRLHLEESGARAVIVPERENGPVRAVASDLGIAVLELRFDPAWPAGCFELRLAEEGALPSPAARNAMAQAGRPRGQDAALVLHTSGTTGRAKVVPLSQANLAASARSIAGHLMLGPDDRCLNVMPLFHVHGLVGSLLATLVSGGSVVCTAGFEEALFFDWVADFEPTWYSAVPTIHQAILARGHTYRTHAPAHRFRFARSASAPLPPATLRALEALLDAPVIEAYGLTETSSHVTINPLPPGLRKPGSAGTPAGSELAILDEAGRELPPGREGEIAVRGPGVMTGYENNPEANAAAFAEDWFRTGDIGRLDQDGYLRVTGRLKEIVNRGGEKVSPREIDEALLEHPAIEQAAAFAVPHPALGEDLVAAVVPKCGAHPDESELREFLFSRLAPHKVPSQIVSVSSLPKGPTGKIQRSELPRKLADAFSNPYVAPDTDTEATVQQIAREVLEGEPLGTRANLFAAGFDSLRGAQLIGRINERLSLDLPVTAVFRHPTIAGLGSLVDRTRIAIREREAILRAEVDALSDDEVDRLLDALEGAAPLAPTLHPHEARTARDGSANRGRPSRLGRSAH